MKNYLLALFIKKDKCSTLIMQNPTDYAMKLGRQYINMFLLWHTERKTAYFIMAIG